MANDRNRYDQGRYGNQDDDRRDREDDGYIARRGFGNRSAGYDRGSGSREPTGHDRSGSDSFGRGSRDYNEERGFFERAGDELRSWFWDDETENRHGGGMRGTGGHRGRGPKGYQRSDARILEDVNERLTEDPHIDASEIAVTVADREVTLTGTVNSRFEKRHAEDLAESVSGVSHVQNNLRIQQYADAGMGGSMLSGAGAAGAGSTGTPQVGAGSTATPRRRGGSNQG